MTAPAKIQLKNITKVYTTEDIETHALRGLDLNIYEGDYLSISGPSGCGKSTLLTILGLLDSPTAGQYFIAGEDVSTLNADQRADIRNRHIGFVFQAFHLIDELSVYDNVALPLRYRSAPLSETEIKQRVMQSLDRVDMSHRIGHKPNQLSGGQQQRIAIARALVGNPTVLLVDEPTGNLDSNNGDAVMKILSQLNQQGTTICMVTHDPRYADMARKQMYLADGVMVNHVELRAAI